MSVIKTLISCLFLCVVTSTSYLFVGQASGFPSVTQAQTQSRQLQRQTDPVKSWPIKAKRWALVIGVDQYRDGQINALKGSVNDAHNLASALVRYAGFPQDQVIVLTTDQADERQPTRINILTYLSNLASLVPKDGLLLVSFAGHGIERGGQAYLSPSDARLSHDVSLLEESAVSVTRMHDRIKAIGVGQVIVLLDACRNDPGGRADAPNNMSAAYTKFNFDVRNREVQAFATFYATAIGQRAYEYTEKRQGYFTWAIVEALKGGAANDKGEVTLAALVKYVQDNVPKRIAIDLGATEQQKPFATIEGYRADELVIAVSGPRIESGANISSQQAVEGGRDNANNSNNDKSQPLLRYDGLYCRTDVSEGKLNEWFKFSNDGAVIAVWAVTLEQAKRAIALGDYRINTRYRVTNSRIEFDNKFFNGKEYTNHYVGSAYQNSLRLFLSGESGSAMLDFRFVRVE